MITIDEFSDLPNEEQQRALVRTIRPAMPPKRELGQCGRGHWGTAWTECEHCKLIDAVEPAREA